MASRAALVDTNKVYFRVFKQSFFDRCDKTNSEGPRKLQNCVFPFTLRNKTFDACTIETDPEGKYWCSTKLDEDGNHQRGEWGYCDLDCRPKDENTTTTSTITT